jgi:hypothetical protein
MKKSSLFTIVSLLLLFSGLCTRSDAQSHLGKEKDEFFADFYVMEVKPMLFAVTYHRPLMDRVAMRITDNTGQVLFVEKALVYKHYKKTFDISKFGDGRYTFELTDGDQAFSKSFEIATRVFRTAVIQNKRAGDETLLDIR